MDQSTNDDANLNLNLKTQFLVPDLSLQSAP